MAKRSAWAEIASRADRSTTNAGTSRQGNAAKWTTFAFCRGSPFSMSSTGLDASRCSAVRAQAKLSPSVAVRAAPFRRLSTRSAAEPSGSPTARPGRPAGPRSAERRPAQACGSTGPCAWCSGPSVRSVRRRPVLPPRRTWAPSCRDARADLPPRAPPSEVPRPCVVHQQAKPRRSPPSRCHASCRAPGFAGSTPRIRSGRCEGKARFRPRRTVGMSGRIPA